ncbi:MAG: Clp protease N-terminal domain-containing protein [Solirubrobacteraceae bacterium]
MARWCDARGLFERFTDSARQVIVLAQEEARGLKHDYIGTEHLLLGLLREEDGLAAQVLGSLGITVELVREQVLQIVGPGEDEVTTGQVPFTPRAKKALQLALREALNLGHNDIGPEHILLGLARENEGLANRILRGCDADASKIRDEVIGVVPGRGARAVTQASGRAVAGTATPDARALRLLMAASARALDDGRSEFNVTDLLLALTGNDETAALLADLGVDEQAMREAIERHRAPTEPPEPSAEA